MPSTRSSTATPNDGAPTLSSIVALLESMKNDIVTLKNNSTELKSMRKDLLTFKDDLTNLSGHFASTISSFQANVNTDLQTLRSDISDRFEDMFSTLDTTIDTARVEWTTAITDSTAPLALHLNKTTEEFTTLLQALATKLTALEGLSVSDDQVLRLLNDHHFDNIRNLILSPIIDTIIQDTVKAEVAPLLQEIQLLKTVSSSLSTSPKPKSGFAQVESKDFNVSKFIKDTDRVKLNGDFLVNLEHFWDSILRIFNTLCLQNQVYPCYRDLKKDFDFKTHLCDRVRLSASELQQAQLNYRAFGDSLRIFLLDPTTISKSTCPKAYLKLLSLKGMKDGFKILRDLLFQLSPQLDGPFIDFGSAISSLQLHNGEHLNEFYSRTQELAREIHIANLPDGNTAALHYHFLSLLRHTGNSTILGITNPYWTSIMNFRRNPLHFTIPKLPWELHEVYAELEASDISILHSPDIPTSSSSSLYHDEYGTTNNNVTPSPIAAYGSLIRPKSNNNNMHNNNLHNNKSSNISSTKPNQQHRRLTLHHTSDGRRFISEPTATTRPLCTLCFNKHPNPWHDTDHCPFKHPTQIIDKDIRERVMQHNALHGAENRHFTRSQDSSNTGARPPPNLSSAARANCAVTSHDDPTSIASSNLPVSEPTTFEDHSSTIKEDIQLHEIINTEVFDVPTVPQANMGNASLLPNITEDYALDELIFDPTQYLSYSS
jgi:hypothetical protein